SVQIHPSPPLSVSPGRPTASKEGRIEPQPFTTSVGGTASYERKGRDDLLPVGRVDRKSQLFGSRLQAADRGYRPNALACDRGDYVKVAVVVTDRKTGDISAGRDQKIRDFDLAVSPLDNQFTPYVYRPIPTVLVVGDLRQYIKVPAKIFKLLLGLGRPQ